MTTIEQCTIAVNFAMDNTMEYAKALNMATAEIVRLHEVIKAMREEAHDQVYRFDLEMNELNAQKRAMEETIKQLKEKLGGIKC